MSKHKTFTFDEVIVDKTRYGTKIKREDYLTKGIYPVFDQGQEYISGYVNDSKGIFNDVPVILFGDHTRVIKYIDVPFFLGADGVKILKSRIEGVSYKYLYYYFLKNEVPNTGYNRHFKWLKELKIPLPPLEVQKQIAQNLDTVSELLALRKKKLEKLDKLIKSVFYDMFGDPVLNEKGWEVCNLGEVCILKSGKSINDDTTKETGVIPYIKVSDLSIEGNYTRINYSKRYVEVASEKDIFPIGCTVFPKRGGAIATNKKRLVNRPIIADSNIMGVIPNKKLHPEYLYYFFQNIDLGTLVNGSSVPQLNNGDISPLKIPLPPLEVQKQFASIVTKIEEETAIVKQAIEETQLLFNSLMSQYFE